YKLELGSALRAASMTNFAQVAILLVCAFCIDRIGRRTCAIVSFLVGPTAEAMRSHDVARLVPMARIRVG
ncbi:hypothetical protein AB9F41_36415, partial [Rhizobium leguminosarum]|uniref:hypothetical protein n=1 Tax=Rhizobium leguminosarum TaxID=384 RepID=UPI003F9E3BE5